ncbi:FAS-associated death domain protein [Monodelphis domestica]|uniref:Fas associated via death domain n=1 Tax=Monodelphis domestica TaxID=13616 RepID=A0A5F8HIC7_MONDO|nr:FAS-associated death domain protein [Monodelphis domestica]
MATVDPFLLALHRISCNLSKKELEDMKFFCKKDIGKKKLNEVEQAIQLFSLLMQQNLLSANNTAFLTSVLRSLKRDDLIQELAKAAGSQPGSGAPLDPAVEEQLEVTFDVLCGHVGRDWKRLVRKLGISQVDIDRIVYAHPHDLREQLYQSLLVWKKSEEKEANVSTIQKALRDCELNLVADILADKLEKMHL